ncbi:hypothetical protein [Cellulomonas carbonis]|uniref:Uncharacterized protein n=1 Tax=Cellulomonas carbonis T26 TaxID=947969 RepID=A0A0A0BU12_9CELL|nr:hypothetical protein [Cellulomonas carbonis]KGM11893.1 hypothetical protein N868_04975 [Cellulomonas carbonis T26]GGB91432.1 hypothetical protein GCM10010972_00070 [Cellulomonas carbonis]
MARLTIESGLIAVELSPAERLACAHFSAQPVAPAAAVSDVKFIDSVTQPIVDEVLNVGWPAWFGSPIRVHTLHTRGRTWDSGARAIAIAYYKQPAVAISFRTGPGVDWGLFLLSGRTNVATTLEQLRA